MRDSVRILVLGDDGVGKSSIITSLIKETFVANVQHVVPEFRISPESSREKVTTRIIDSSSRPENRDQLELEIKKADVLIIVYAVDRMETFYRIKEFWLPFIRLLGRNVPVVLVGNKTDTRNEGEDSKNDSVSLENLIAPLMNEFKEVESCVECSSKLRFNISEVFFFAQKAVLYPTAPLYDSREHSLKPAATRALRRIFALCDKDKDEALNDEEINDLQSKCFDIPLQHQELNVLRGVVIQNSPQGYNSNGLTEQGFLYLHTLIIQRGRLETTWIVLRKFGYDDDLSLREDFLYPKLEVPLGSVVELSSEGIQFFTDLFLKFDKDQDGALNVSEIDKLFKTAPSHPWVSTEFPETTVTDENGSVTLNGFLAQWSLTTCQSYKTTLAYLAYLGFPNDDTTLGLKIVPKKQQSQRDCFLCYVFGATGSGKTSFMRGCLGKTFQSNYIPTIKEFSIVNSIEVYGVEKELVMQEYGPQFDAEVLSNKKKLESCDVLCFVYDSGDPHSFAYVANLRDRYAVNNIPCVFVATKSDLDLVPQIFTLQPDAYCRKLGLPVPISVSIKNGITAEIYKSLVGVALDPSVAIVGGPPSNILNISMIGISALVLLGGIAIAWKIYKN